MPLDIVLDTSVLIAAPVRDGELRLNFCGLSETSVGGFTYQPLYCYA